MTAGQAPRREAFLLESDFRGGGWKPTVQAFLETFRAEDPVGLILLPGPGALPHPEVEAAVVDLATRLRAESLPDVILPTEAGGLLPELRAFARVHRLPFGAQGLPSPLRARFQAALGPQEAP